MKLTTKPGRLLYAVSAWHHKSLRLKSAETKDYIMHTTLTTLCYIEQDDKYLMLHRVKKHEDVNKGKWIGVGGKLEIGENPEECLIREVREETGFVLTGFRYRGLITFVYADKEPEYIFTYTSKEFEIPSAAADAADETGKQHTTDAVNAIKFNTAQQGQTGDADTASCLPLPECDEGIFAWVEKNRILTDLELWEGDRYMLDYLLQDRHEPFSLKLCYDSEDRLVEAWEMAVRPVRLK